MPKGVVLELASVTWRHPLLAFYEMYGIQAAIRLSRDPVQAKATVSRRTVLIDYLAAGASHAITLTREIDWAGCFPEDYSNRGLDTGAEVDITEKAALVVMALLIHDIAGIEIRKVVSDGTGPDYETTGVWSGENTRIEVSGIRENKLSTARTRLHEKTEQLLANYSHGFVSVTTFSMLPDRGLHSFLHCAGTPPIPKKPRKRKQR